MLTSSQTKLIKDLIEEFKANKAHSNSEEHVQSLYTLRLLQILGWQASQLRINQGQEVKTGKKPDILIHNNEDTLLVIESKEPSKATSLDGYYQKQGVKVTFPQQLRQYCNGEGVYWGILTNFIEWRVYAAYHNRLYKNIKFAFTDLLWNKTAKRDYLDLLSPSGSGFLSRLEPSNLIPLGGRWDDDPIYYPAQEEIKEQFFRDLKEWRSLLSQEYQRRLPCNTNEENEENAQKMLNRLIFIDYCSDNSIISQDRLHAALHSKGSISNELARIFQAMDTRFNSELFAPSECDKTALDDSQLSYIIKGLADIDFSKLSANVIGEVYEKYLGDIQRASQGIYYTPDYIVDYIVENTVGKVLHECTSIDEIRVVRVLDQSCGSGSFLIRVFDEFLKYYRKFEDSPLFEFEIRKSILLNNIYGVDLDPRAVEITKLNLMVKALEGTAYLNIEGDKILPNIKLNIRCGNSLVSGSLAVEDLGLFWNRTRSVIKELNHYHTLFGSGSDHSTQPALLESIYFKEHLLNKDLNCILPDCLTSADMNPFNYEVAFPQVMERGGFDCVVGNPPYIDSEAMCRDQPEVRAFASAHMAMASGNWDIYIAFFDRAFSLVKENGYVGFITPDKWISKDFGLAFRQQTIDHLVSLLRAGRDVFTDARVDSMVSIWKTTRVPSINVYELIESDVYERTSVEKSAIDPPYEYDYIFSPHIDLLHKISSARNNGHLSFLCENACATSDCYKLKPFLCSVSEAESDSSEYYKVINTGTIAKYYSRWGKKSMTYLKSKYDFPVVSKRTFHDAFVGSYGGKAPMPKLIIKGLTLLDATIDYSGEYLPAKSTLVVTAGDAMTLEYLCALFNSRLAYFYISQKYSSATYNGGITFTKAMLNSFPVSQPDEQSMETIGRLVRQMIELLRSPDQLTKAKQKEWRFDVLALQDQLEEKIQKLYSIDQDESLAIAGAVGNKGLIV